MTTATRGRPIIFSAPMVRAILAGAKTQTRRVVKVDPTSPNGCPIREIVPSLLANRGDLWDVRYEIDNPKAARCPYGQPGDRLWVRETLDHDLGQGAWVYRSDRQPIRVAMGFRRDADAWRFRSPDFCSSIHMPRWASRITLEITEIRVERLQDISEDDAAAEGADGDCPVGYIPAYDAGPLRYHFAQIWELIHGDGSWGRNSWVWAISFRRLEARP